MEIVYRVIYASAKLYKDFEDNLEAEAFQDKEGGVIEVFVDGVYDGHY